MDEIIPKNRIAYGRVNITVPMTVKQSMLSWIKKSGMGKSEFLRVALMMGTIHLADQVKAKDAKEGFISNNE